MFVKFIEQMEKATKSWPDNTKLSPMQIADICEMPVPHVLEALNQALDKSLDVHEPISRKDSENALTILRQRMHHEIEAERRRRIARQEKAQVVLEKTLEKVTALQTQKQFHAAYKTLSYFVGLNESYLAEEAMISCCADCVRLGLKAGVNVQELGTWLEKGAMMCRSTESMESIESALDFVEAYADEFSKNASGARFVTCLTDRIRLPSQINDPLALGQRLLPSQDILDYSFE